MKIRARLDVWHSGTLSGSRVGRLTMFPESEQNVSCCRVKCGSDDHIIGSPSVLNPTRYHVPHVHGMR